MATPIHPDIPLQQIACSVFLKEVPLSLAKTPEGADYIEYFCGVECYAEFVVRHETETAAAQKNIDSR